MKASLFPARLAFCLCMLASSCGRPELAVEEISAEPYGATVQREFPGKAQVKIDLQGGFKAEEVAVYVDGRKRFSKKITTNQATSLADRLEFEWKRPELTLGVVLEKEKREWHCKLDLKLGTNVGVNKLEGRIRIVQSDTPFGYY